MPPKRDHSVTLYNIIPLAWPYWAWGLAPSGLALVPVILLGGYLWNVFVLAGLLVLLGQSDRVGQKALLGYALWATLAGAAADVAHVYVLDWVSSHVDLLLVDAPLANVGQTLLLPAGIILLANLVLSLVLWRLSALQALILSVGMALLTMPWLALGAIDVGREIVAREALTGLYLAIAVASLIPWAMQIAAAVAAAGRRSAGWARLMALLAAVLVLVGLGAETCQAPVTSQGGPLPGQLAFAARGKVYLMEGASGEKRVLASDSAELVAWSPDGQRILVQRQAPGAAAGHIYVLNVRDGSFTRLANGRVLPTAWSPDSRSLLFTTDRASQEGLVWRLRLGDDPVEVSEGTTPAWSPDARRIALSARRGGRAQVWVVNPDGSDPIQLTSDGGESPAWSPDGERIAYTFNSRVYVMAADGSGKRQITTGEELFDRSPALAWAPDGKQLAYAHFLPPQGGRPTVIYVVNMETGAKVRFSADYQPPLAWSPDGRWLALVRKGEVWGIRLADAAERRLSPGSGFVWGGERAQVTVKPAPTYPPTPTPTPLPAAVVESPDVLVVNPRNTTTLYAGTPQGVMKRTQSGGWVASSAGILYPLRVRAVALDAGNTNVVYAGTDGERSQQGGTLYKSQDGGLRWTATNLRGVDIYAIAIDPLNPNIVYAGTLKGVSKSVDAGANWQTAGTGLKGAAVQSLAIDPSPPKGASPGVSYTLYAGARQGGIYKSVDGAANWTLQEPMDIAVTAIAVSTAKPSVVFASTAEGLYRTTDAGARWSPVAGGIWKYKLDGVAIDPRTPGVVYVVGPRGVFKSSDGGDNWGPTGPGLVGAQPTALAIDPDDPLILYAGTDKGVFKSANGGVYWER